MQSQPQVYIVTYGCKVNYYESESVASLLSAARVPNRMITDGAIARLPDAAVFVVNSCAVTSMAEKKVRYGLHKIAKYHPHAMVVSMGCALGRKTPEDVATAVCKALGQSNPPGKVIPQHARERAFIKVQDGCQNFCSYCIIPYRRNQLSHRSIAEVTAEINAQTPHVAEIVLCGINLCYYPNFADLCRAVDACGRHWWISSLEPPILTSNLIQTLKDCPNFVPNFHICLQSGSDNVLQAMNRHYTTADYARIIRELRAAFPNAYFATDIIVGYPTETAEDFQITYDFLQQIKLDKLHLFPFSPRPGTPAANLKPLTNSVVTRRYQQLSTLSQN